MRSSPTRRREGPNLRRRRLLQAAACASLPLPPELLRAASAADPSGTITLPAAFAAFLDTLLPADSTPSASQLDVDKALLERADRQVSLGRLIRAGCGWLDAEARKRGGETFAALSEVDRAQIVATAERSATGSLPAAFFAVTQRLAFQAYYAHPRAWVGLGFAGPPQPVGFPDHNQPPQREQS